LRLPSLTLFPYTTLFRSIDTRRTLMIDTTFHTQTGHSQRAPWARPAIRKYGCSAQSFCPECRPGNHAHVDSYGRPEYHCPSSRRSEEHTSELQSRSDLVC